MFISFVLAACTSGLEQEETQPLLHFTDKETEAQRDKETSLRSRGLEREDGVQAAEPLVSAPLLLHPQPHLVGLAMVTKPP